MTADKSASDSYISDVVYSSFYNPQLNPLNLHFIALQAGLRQGKLAADFSYCDLGCGDGTILNMLASLFPQARFYGVDFNREHIAAARKRAGAAGLENIVYHQLDFARLGATDFPPLDFINCFGTFSWINRSLQDTILDFAGNSLVEGGVFSVHYAAKPGKVQIDPLWHLMRILTGDMEASSTERVRFGVDVIDVLKDGGARFFRENPVAQARADALTGQDLNYLAHEALSEWQAFHLSEIAGRARKQGLQYAGMQSPMDNDPDLTIPDSFRPILDGYTDPVVRAGVEDYILNRGLRFDVYVKTTGTAIANAVPAARQPVWLNSPTGRITPSFTAANGKTLSLQSPLYDAIVTDLRQDVRSAAELRDKPAFSSWSEAEIVAAITRLVASGQVIPVIGHSLAPAGPVSPADCRPALTMTREILGGDLPAAGFINLPSPLLGQCVPVDQVIGLSLAALLFHAGNEVDWVAGQIRNAGVAGIQGVPTDIAAQDTPDLANKSLQMTATAVLPALVRFGVYVQAGNSNR